MSSAPQQRTPIETPQRILAFLRQIHRWILALSILFVLTIPAGFASVHYLIASTIAAVIFFVVQIVSWRKASVAWASAGFLASMDPALAEKSRRSAERWGAVRSASFMMGQQFLFNVFKSRKDPPLWEWLVFYFQGFFLSGLVVCLLVAVFRSAIRRYCFLDEVPNPQDGPAPPEGPP